MPYYPVYINLKGRICLVIGIGAVGLRKVKGLLECGAIVHAVAQTIPKDIILPEHKNFHFFKREFTDDDVRGCALVFAATNERSANQRIAALCAEQGILCTVADNPAEGSFINPALLDCGPLRIALSSGGLSPAFVKRLKNELEAWLDIEYTRQIILLGRLRPLLKNAGLAQAENAVIYRKLADKTLGDALGAHDMDACRNILEDTLPHSLWIHIAELLHDLD
jgi:precorrin-2 dehydrogenase/sirohydrochlorin ferrochelatase